MADARRTTRSQELFRRAQELMPAPESVSADLDKFASTWVRFYPAHRLWALGDVDASLAELERQRAGAPATSGWPRWWFAHAAADWSRQTRAEIEELIRSTDLEQQMPERTLAVDLPEVLLPHGAPRQHVARIRAVFPCRKAAGSGRQAVEGPLRHGTPDGGAETAT